MSLLRFFEKSYLAVIFLTTISHSAYAATVNFSAPLEAPVFDTGSAIYSNTPIGTIFSGFIDDATFNGEITNGTILTSFDCCIAAGGLSVSNNIILEEEEIDYINALVGFPKYTFGDPLDVIDIEGDTTTATGGRIEVGLSYLFDSATFNSNSLSNYPFNPNDLELAAFFIFEEDASGNALYSGGGRLNIAPVPLPAAAWLFITGIVGLRFFVKKRAST